MLRMYNLDWDLALGIKGGNQLSVYAGFRKNFLMHYSTGGSLKRTITKYDINVNGAAGNYEYYDEEYANNRVKDVWTQYVYGLFFIDFGCNYRFKVREAPYFAEVELCMPPDPFYGYYQKFYLNLKLAKCFR
jgi:hypothetical protein